MRLDRMDRRILAALQAEGRISNVDLAQRVGLSESPCLRRVRTLEERQVITAYRATLDQRCLGLTVTAFVQVQLDKHDDRKTRTFLERVANEDHIVECHAMSGAYDISVESSRAKHGALLGDCAARHPALPRREGHRIELQPANRQAGCGPARRRGALGNEKRPPASRNRVHRQAISTLAVRTLTRWRLLESAYSRLFIQGFLFKGNGQGAGR